MPKKMNENAQFETLDEGKIKLTAMVEAGAVDRAIAKVYRDGAKKYKFPGFRPGKAPRSMVEQLIGAEYARALATDDVVNATFPNLVDAAGYRVIGQASFDEEMLVDEGKDFTYCVEFDVRPRLKINNSHVSVKMPPREATDAEVNTQIDSVRGRFAQLAKIKSRKINADDFVVISFDSTLDGEPYEGSKVENYTYQMGKNMMPQQFEKAIVGAKPGDTVTAEFMLEDTGENTEFAGKTIRFDIELHELHAPELPEVNDELAKMSGFETEEEMRSEIRSSIEDSKQNSYDNVLRQRLVSALGEQLKGDIPEVMLDARKTALRQEFASSLKENDMTIESYLAMSGASEEDFDKDVATQAAMAMAEELALEALAAQENLVPTDDEITEELGKIGEQSEVSAEIMRERFEEASMITALRDELSRRSAVEWLVDHSTVEIDEEAM